MKEIFVSYSHSDSDFAEIVRLQLEGTGYSVWIDHIGLQAGNDWRQGIDDAIRNASAILLIVSPEAMQSPYTTYEWAFGYGIGKIVIPVLYKPTTLHPKLETLQYLDFTHRTNRPWNTLFQRLQSI